MLTRLVAIFIIMLGAAQNALAAEDAASFLTKLFIRVCVPNMGEPEKVREWALAHHLTQVQDQAGVEMFVGPGGKGAAWAVPTDIGNFALSMRGMTQACAVWARVADAAEVQANFTTIIEGVRRPGIVVSIDQEKSSAGPFGVAHALVYNVTVPNVRSSYEFTMLTAERPGGRFQASLQVAKAGPD